MRVSRVCIVSAPSKAVIRGMLSDLLASVRSQDKLAATLGVTRFMLRCWIAGLRKPGLGSARLIWLVHRLRFNPESLRKSETWLRWL